MREHNCFASYVCLMPAKYPSRGHTRGAGFVKFAESGKTFDEWNGGYERWLIRQYTGRDSRPWHAHFPWSTFAVYNLPPTLQRIKKLRKTAEHYASLIIRIMRDELMDPSVAGLRRIEAKRREELVLTANRLLVATSDWLGATLDWDEAPELTPDSRNLNLLRLQDSTFEATTESAPLSAGIRVWIELGYATRHAVLSTFCYLIIALHTGKSSEDECRVTNWSRHKPFCGNLLSGTISIPTTAADHRKMFPVQQIHLDFLKYHLRLVEGIWSRDQPTRSWTTPTPPGEIIYEIKWELPIFVRPYRPVLEQIISHRNRAYENRDPVSIGILVLFLDAADRYAVHGGRKPTKEERLGRYRRNFELKPDVLARFVRRAASEVSGKKEHELVKSCLEQLKSGKPDTSWPDDTVPITAIHIYDTLLRTSTAFCAFLPDNTIYLRNGGNPVSALLDPSIEPFLPILAAIRKVAFRALESGGKDRLAVGVLQTLYTAHTCTIPDLPVEDAFVGTFVDEYMAGVFGLEKKDVTAMRLEAGDALVELAKEEGGWALIAGGIKHYVAMGRPTSSTEAVHDRLAYMDRLLGYEAGCMAETVAKVKQSNQRRKRRKKEKVLEGEENNPASWVDEDVAEEDVVGRR
ncbi:hypothetical protein JCM8547_001515 [Rhodosporidiobolus lusitaniae]